MLAYTTSTTDRPRGWDAFDNLVLWAVGARPRQTFDDVAALLPAGVAYHLIRAALNAAIADGFVVRTVSAVARYQITPAGQYRLAGTSSPDHLAAA